MNIEHRSIEFIPECERYGSPKRLFTVWFSVNMQVTALLVGTLSVIEGLNLFWTFVALITGAVIGSIFMAAHSSQGPHLGIPQMIQSRAQFGVLGAAFPLLVVVLSYVLFFAANSVIMRESIKAVCPVSDDAAIVIFGVVTMCIAFVGYELVHRVGYVLSCLSASLFAMTLFLALHGSFPEHIWSPALSAFKWATFMLAVTQAASWSIGFGPLVADYSRYIPKTASTAQTFWYSYLGQAVGSLFVMLLGASLSGLLGVSEISSDMRELLDREAGDVRAAEAVAMFCYHIKKCIGAFAAALGGLDTLVFAGGIGENAPQIRSRVCEGLGFLGVEIDEKGNAANAAMISSTNGRVAVRVIRTDEELMIAKMVCRLLEKGGG